MEQGYPIPPVSFEQHLRFLGHRCRSASIGRDSESQGQFAESHCKTSNNENRLDTSSQADMLLDLASNHRLYHRYVALYQGQQYLS